MYYVLTFNEFRKNKMQKLFSQLGISHYKFINAINPYSPIINDYIKKYNIENQWGCIICDKPECNHVINTLTRFHISNFFGFQKMITPKEN